MRRGMAVSFLDQEMRAVRANNNFLGDDHVSCGMAVAFKDQADVLVVARTPVASGDAGGHDGNLDDVTEVLNHADLRGKNFIVFSYRKGAHFMSVVVDVKKGEIAFSNSTDAKKDGTDFFYSDFIRQSRGLAARLEAKVGKKFKLLPPKDSKAKLYQSDGHNCGVFAIGSSVVEVANRKGVGVIPALKNVFGDVGGIKSDKDLSEFIGRNSDAVKRSVIGNGFGYRDRLSGVGGRLKDDVMVAESSKANAFISLVAEFRRSRQLSESNVCDEICVLDAALRKGAVVRNIWNSQALIAPNCALATHPDAFSQHLYFGNSAMTDEQAINLSTLHRTIAEVMDNFIGDGPLPTDALQVQGIVKQVEERIDGGGAVERKGRADSIGSFDSMDEYLMDVIAMEERAAARVSSSGVAYDRGDEDLMIAIVLSQQDNSKLFPPKASDIDLKPLFAPATTELSGSGHSESSKDEDRDRLIAEFLQQEEDASGALALDLGRGGRPITNTHPFSSRKPGDPATKSSGGRK